MSWNITFWPNHPITWTAPQDCKTREEALDAFKVAHGDSRISSVEEVVPAKGRSQYKSELREKRLAWLKNRTDLTERWVTKSNRSEALDANRPLWRMIVIGMKQSGLVSKTTYWYDVNIHDLMGVAKIVGMDVLETPFGAEDGSSLEAQNRQPAPGELDSMALAETE